MSGPALLVVLGSATPPGRFRRALEEAVERAAATGDRGPADRPRRRPHRTGRCAAAGGRRRHRRRGGADSSARAVVLATPVYRGSLTGTLKNLSRPRARRGARGQGRRHRGDGRDAAPLPRRRPPPARRARVVRRGRGPGRLVPLVGRLRDGAPSPEAAAELDALLADTLRLSKAPTGRWRCHRWPPAARETDPRAGRSRGPALSIARFGAWHRNGHRGALLRGDFTLRARSAREW